MWPHKTDVPNSTSLSVCCCLSSISQIYSFQQLFIKILLCARCSARGGLTRNAHPTSMSFQPSGWKTHIQVSTCQGIQLAVGRRNQGQEGPQGEKQGSAVANAERQWERRHVTQPWEDRVPRIPTSKDYREAKRDGGERRLLKGKHNKQNLQKQS